MEYWTVREEKELQEKLRGLSEEKFRSFTLTLLPGVDQARVLGVRLPLLRKVAKSIFPSERREAFLSALPHDLYEEDHLHSFLIAGEKDFERAVGAVDSFLPYVDNWSVCDSLRPAVFPKEKERLLPEIQRWIASPKTFTCRFGIEMLMVHFLDDAFSPEYAAAVAALRRGEYYVNMMIAWYFATALTKQEKEIFPYFEGEALAPDCRRKAIRKCLESDRIRPEIKQYLRTL